MLQRAASNAYSWWWASHIRTKQSKWLEKSLQDMEEKVKNVLKLVEEDADSFAKRAEMYYRKRPELINFIEETYRAYRALAERYDHLSGELQSANNTIANVFPGQVQFGEDADENEENAHTGNLSVVRPPKFPQALLNISKLSMKISESKSPFPLKKMQTVEIPASVMSTEAVQEIDKLQKGILVLQTEKEFVKTSYETALAKYLEIEAQVMEMQKKVGNLKDQFNVEMGIEDDDARVLMAAAALKSCEDTLSHLQVQQKRTKEEAKIASVRVRLAEEKLKALKGDTHLNSLKNEKVFQTDVFRSSPENMDEKVVCLKLQEQELETIRQEVSECFETSSRTSLSVTEMAEKIDELVGKVLTLETAVSSQTALINRLITETDGVHMHLQDLETEKTTLLHGSNRLSETMKHMEEELRGIQYLSFSVQDQESQISEHFTEARRNLGDLSGKLLMSKECDKIEIMGSFNEKDNQDGITGGLELLKSCKEDKRNQATFADKSSEMNDVQVLQREEAYELAVETDACSIKDIPMRPVEETHELANSGDEGIRGNDLPREQEDEKYQTSTFAEMCVKVMPVKLEKNLSVLELHTEGWFKAKDMLVAVEEEMHDDSSSVMESDLKFLSTEAQLSSAEPEPEQNAAKSAKKEIVKEQEHADMSTPDYLGVVGLDTELVDSTWQQLLLNDLEPKEKIMLAEYTSVIRGYKDIKKKLSELEKKNQEKVFQSMAEVRELKSSNMLKDLEIRSLRQRLNELQIVPDEKFEIHIAETKNTLNGRRGSKLDRSRSWLPDFSSDYSSQCFPVIESERSTVPTDKSREILVAEEEIKLVLVDEQNDFSSVEEKFRRDVDELLEENLEFWFRFSTLFHQIQKYQTRIQDIKTGILKIKERYLRASNMNGEGPLEETEVVTIDKRLRELQKELSGWLDQNALLKDELQCKLSSLIKLQEKISHALEKSSTNELNEFTALQAARFQGEILNIQQENSKVAEELQAGWDHVKELQLDAKRTLSKLKEKFDDSHPISNWSQHNHFTDMRHTMSRSKIPLRSFIFGAKPKKSKPSVFSCMNPSLYKYHGLRVSGRSIT